MSSATPTSPPTTGWTPGRPVAVRNRFTGRFAAGFRIEDATTPGAYRVRRLSDDAVLPAVFSPEELRPV